MNLSPDFEFLRSWVEHLPEIFAQSGTMLYHGRNVIKSYRVGEEHLVVKRFKRLGLFKSILYSYFLQGKARRSFLHAAELIARGIDTPAPVACLEVREHGLIRDSYYVCSHTSFAELGTLMPPHGDTYPPALAKAFARYVSGLHQSGILHLDLNSGNVLFRERPEGGYDFQLIDINRMKFLPVGQPLSLADCMENLTLFTGNMDLHKFVLREYALDRGLDVDQFVQDATTAKLRHDARWIRRKKWAHPIRTIQRFCQNR